MLSGREPLSGKTGVIFGVAGFDDGQPTGGPRRFTVSPTEKLNPKGEAVVVGWSNRLIKTHISLFSSLAPKS